MRFSVVSGLILLAIITSAVAEETPEKEPEPVNRTLVWPDGTRYVGEVVDGQRSGKGTIFWQDGTRFVGQFENDKRNGPGTMIMPDGKVYSGVFQDDKLVSTSPSVEAEPPGVAIPVEKPSPSEKAVVADREITPEPVELKPDADNKTAAVEPEPGKTSDKPHEISAISDEVKQELIDAVDDWGTAWANQNVSTYLSAYADDFVVPGNLSRKGWEALRRSRIKRPAWIKVSLVYERFELVDGNLIEVFFRQTYDSDVYRDVTNKRMLLRRAQEEWLIVEESSLSSRQ